MKSEQDMNRKKKKQKEKDKSRGYEKTIAREHRNIAT